MFVYPAHGIDGGRKWYLIRNGQAVAAQREPQDSRTARTCLERLDAVFAKGDLAPVRTAIEDFDMVLLVAGWFRKNPGELECALPPEEASSMCRQTVRRLSRSSARD